ncbi:Copia protein [Symbiodinium microadriaticum]|uniref:Copia protein n=1 Tax=Symbiodinium microadriaticum TaxID=2951 RepID=A0A1Q9D4B9_SYMMI|nr:Copia protein [Symbiodinium microadriaticum]
MLRAAAGSLVQLRIMMRISLKSRSHLVSTFCLVVCIGQKPVSMFCLVVRIGQKPVSMFCLVVRIGQKPVSMFWLVVRIGQKPVSMFWLVVRIGQKPVSMFWLVVRIGQKPVSMFWLVVRIAQKPAEGDEAFLEVNQSKNRDLLGESLYGYLFELALAGKVQDLGLYWASVDHGYWGADAVGSESDSKEAIARLKVVPSDPVPSVPPDALIPDSWSDVEEAPDEPVPADKDDPIPAERLSLVGEVWEDDGVFWDEGQQVAIEEEEAGNLPAEAFSADMDPLRGFTFKDVPEGNGVCGRQGSAEVVEDPGVAYLLPPEDAEAVVAETFYLPRVVTQERYALLEEIRLTDPSSLPSVDSLANLEMRISRLQAELELSRAAESFQQISTVNSDSVRVAKCRLAAAVASGPMPADVQNEGVQEDIMFQTRTVDPQEANSQIQRWVAPLTEEYIGLTSQYRAILPVDISELDDTSCETEVCYSEPSLWKILDQHNHLHGLLGAYVDDFLLTALQNVLDSTLAVIRSKWEVSEPKQVGVHDVHFLGVDLHLAGDVYYMSQVGYVAELLKRHPEVSGVAWAPFPSTKEDDTGDMLRSEEAPNLALVRKAQGLLGELTWLATKTRIDIAWSTNKASQLTAKHPEQAIEICHTVSRYLRQHPDLAISFGPHDDLGVLQVYADAAFAPGGARSQTGALVLWSEGLVGWFTSRQSFVTLSTAESELYASIEGMVLHDSIRPLLEELVNLEVPTLFSDNVANVAINSVPAGEVMIADVLTKALPPLRMTKLLQLANVVQLPRVTVSGSLFGVCDAQSNDQSESGLHIRAIYSNRMPAFTIPLFDLDDGVSYSCAADIQGPNGEPIKTKTSLVYLGSVISASGSITSEVNRRLGMAKADFDALSRVWKHAPLTCAKKLQIFSACVVSRLMYSLHTAWLCKADLRKIDAFQARCLRSILDIPHSFISHVRNETVLQEAGTEKLSIIGWRRQLLLLGRIAQLPREDVMRTCIFHDGTFQPRWHDGLRKRGTQTNMAFRSFSHGSGYVRRSA